MESLFAAPASNNAAFFYYTPDTQTNKAKHHGHFLPHPSSSTAQSSQLLAPASIPPSPSFPSQLVYGGSESTQQARSLAPALSITPVASPSLRNTDMSKENSDMFYHPTTPPLSYSVVSTPALTSSMLTPMSNHGWSVEEPVCGTVAPSDMQLASSMGWSPHSPETNTYVFPSQTTQTPSIVVNDAYCPALSPSSSQTSSSPDLDFCDPRHLTFNNQGASESEFTMEFPALSSFATENNDGQWQGTSDLVTVKTENKKFDNFWGGLFELEENNTDLEWEDDLDTLSRTLESPTSPTDGYITPGEESMQPTFLSTDTKIKVEACPQEAERLRNFKFGTREVRPSKVTKSSATHSNSVIRRGRKQSLTEDPSKTFVCHLCNRRFRRQEHLKRHFRSLHTEDKPFSCGECGKKFSRSDNLTQHARIHGSGAIVLGVLEENQIIDSRQRFSLSHEEPLGLSIVMDPLAIADKENQTVDEKCQRRKKRKNEEQI